MYFDPAFPDWGSKAWKLVASLRLSDPAVEAAMRRIPRHRFLSRGLWPTAYVDTPLPIGPEATISAPHMVAIQLSLAQISPGMRVLELGSGCGYLASIASLLTGPEGLVVGVEFERDLVERSVKVLGELGFPIVRDAAVNGTPNATSPGVSSGSSHPSTVSLPGKEVSPVRIHHGNGYAGAPAWAPFDRIIVSYAGPSPEGEPWIEQLGPEGIAVVPVEQGPDHTEIEVWRRARTGWTKVSGPPCLFVRRKA